MKKLLITLATTVALVGPAMACDPARAGDQYEKNGVTYEVVKTNDSCYTKVCVRPVGSKQACRWIKEPENYDVKWSDSRLSASRTTRTSQTSGPISSSSRLMGRRDETRRVARREKQESRSTWTVQRLVLPDAGLTGLLNPTSI